MSKEGEVIEMRLQPRVIEMGEVVYHQLDRKDQWQRKIRERVKLAEEVEVDVREGGGYVYFVRMVGTDYLKVGYTRSIKRRMEELGRNIPMGLELLACDWSTEAKGLERAYHKEMKGRKVVGEWFRVEGMERVIKGLREKLSKRYDIEEV